MRRCKMVDKPCEDCGTMLLNVIANRKLCPNCARERERVRDRMRQKSWVNTGAEIQKQKGESVEDINRKAIAAGMSYGQYVAMMNERKEKMK